MIRRQIVVPAAPERVWEFITDPDAAGPWLGGRLVWSPAVGGELSFESDDGTVRRGVVEEVRPNRYIRYTWWPAGPDVGPDAAPPSEVALLLEAVGEGTRVTAMEKMVDVERDALLPTAEPRPGTSATAAPAPRPLAPRPPAPRPPVPRAPAPRPPAPPASSASGPAPVRARASVPSSARASALAARSPARWSAGDELMLSSWARARSLCQIG